MVKTEKLSRFPTGLIGGSLLYVFIEIGWCNLIEIFSFFFKIHLSAKFIIWKFREWIFLTLIDFN